ncbi:DUF1127 domain-containing protein [Bradyrhizobium sp. GCM10027634]|uniref:DUF1127 domain-containing protein n=1 Tax=unclassified Bradyrhizobium TaxID=2631580 RepID=UPI001889DA20|nr:MULTISPECIES: DUF1127 domain-containing protein [unclassified Bradyrhizobium]MDN5005394.1 DUF1127 domain-containing protein [Bradyrhizobium sp. WYCCWR 12677]QOZ44108.1 hypothetical protein XH89_11915 [Bradyrhizobium sp. CCBAU 53340]
MPPQQTDISPGIEADAARRGLALSIVQAKGAIDQALAERLKASAKALDGALLDKEAGSGRSVLGLLKRSWRALQRRRQGLRVSLYDLGDRELMDIGLTRGEINYLTPQRAIDTLRDSTTHLWSGRGM